jgi:hypothetical protein
VPKHSTVRRKCNAAADRMLRHACGFKLANDGHDTCALQAGTPKHPEYDAIHSTRARSSKVSGEISGKVSRRVARKKTREISKDNKTSAFTLTSDRNDPLSVQVRQTLGVGAIIDLDAGEFRKYNNVFHTRGLLFCASFNEAMNARIAELVKGAHILTAIAVVALVIAALPSIYLLAPSDATTKTQIVGPVDIASPSLVGLISG